MVMKMKLIRVNHNDLNSRKKEIHNFQKVAGRLADYGFNCIKLDDDWQGADFLAYHKDGLDTLKVQLKSRRGYRSEIHRQKHTYRVSSAGHWYLIEHDVLVQKVRQFANWLTTHLGSSVAPIARRA